jgi:Bacterial PH domain
VKVSTATAFEFYPDRWLGELFHILLILVLAVIGLWGLWQASRAEVGPAFLLYLLPALVAVILAPVLIYRLRGLERSGYTLERNGIRLRWGLRLEEIPMDKVVWVRTSDELQQQLPKPWLRWPGCVLGTRRLAEAKEIEYMAAGARHLILINTPGRIFAISPAAPENFLLTYHRLAELGSLSPIAAQSIYPGFLLARFWSDLPARYLVLSSLVLSLALLIWVILVAPTRGQVLLRPVIDQTVPSSPNEYVPALQLLLLPVLNSFIFIANLLLGLFFYRRDENRVLAYLLWGGGMVTPVLFLIAVHFILQAG